MFCNLRPILLTTISSLRIVLPVLLFFLAPLIFSASFAQAAITNELWGEIKKSDISNFENIVLEANKGTFSEALKKANNLERKTALFDALIDVILWKKYSQQGLDTKAASFSDISRFINDNQFFPNITDLRKNAEKVAIDNKVNYRYSEQYFKNYPATTIESKLYLLESRINYLNNLKDGYVDNNPNFKVETLLLEIKDLIVDIWLNGNFSAKTEDEFLRLHGIKLSESDHVNRIIRLLWEDKKDDAKRIFDLVSPDYQKLFSAIITMVGNPKSSIRDVDNIILSVPRKLRDNELLYYKKVLWYKNFGREDKVIDLLENVSAKASRPDKWWSLRKLYSRELLKIKKYKVAYSIAAEHGLKVDSPDYAEAEWMAGWIALRFLDKSSVAYGHFERLYAIVKYPVSISRAAYWLGMASQAMGDKKKAIDWYKVAIKYPTYFYGQIAIHKHRVIDSIGSESDIILPRDPEIKDQDIKSVASSMSVKVAYLLSLTGYKPVAVKIFEQAINNAESEGQIAVIMKLVNELGDRELDSKVSRFAAKKNVFFIKDKFQIVKEVESDPYAPLVHAIIKQESGFIVSAFSSVGAIGFMQLMPDTAKLVCKQLNIPYDRKKLATSVKYNVILGSYYIKSLVEKFNGSEILAIASYNAGPNATKRWINEFYDPRNENDIDRIVDWIELVTYSETRNYIQRIMENVIVYKYIMSRVNYDKLQ